MIASLPGAQFPIFQRPGISIRRSAGGRRSSEPDGLAFEARDAVIEFGDFGDDVHLINRHLAEDGFPGLGDFRIDFGAEGVAHIAEAMVVDRQSNQHCRNRGCETEDERDVLRVAQSVSTMSVSRAGHSGQPILIWNLWRNWHFSDWARWVIPWRGT